jgi:hypothetical protein
MAAAEAEAEEVAVGLTATPFGIGGLGGGLYLLCVRVGFMGTHSEAGVQQEDALLCPLQRAANNEQVAYEFSCCANSTLSFAYDMRSSRRTEELTQAIEKEDRDATP